jgi:hypothetical protein
MTIRTVKVKQSHNTPMEAQAGKDVYLLLTHDLGTRCGRVVSVMPDRALPPGKDPWYPLDRRLGKPQRQSALRG